MFFRRKIKYTEPLARRYVEETLRRERGVAPEGYLLEPFDHGCGRVFKMTAQGAEPRVVHFHPLAKRHEPDTFFRIHAYLEGLGFPIPRLLDQDRSSSTRRRYGLEVSIEQFVEGAHFRDEMQSRGDVVDRLAQLLARFHRVTSAGHGKPWKPTGRPALFPELLGKIKELYARVGARSDLVAKKEVREHLRWFASWEERISDGSPYRLLHGEYHGDNVLIRPDGSLCVLDIVTSGFGHFEQELAYCESSLIGGSPAFRDRFFQEYFRAVGDGLSERYERNAPFFRAQILLGKTAKNISSARKKKEGKKPGERKAYDEVAARQIEEIREIVGTSRLRNDRRETR